MRHPFLLLALAAAPPAFAQTIRYTTDGFEAPRFVPGQLADDHFNGNGQDDWIVTASIGGQIDFSKIYVQDQTVWAGSQAATVEASGHNTDFFHLRKNTQFQPLSNPAEPVLDISLQVRLDSSSNPSDSWTFQAQSGPGSGSEIFSWDIHPDGHLYYFDSVSGAEVDSGFLFTRDQWHQVVTSLDYVNLEVSVSVDGQAVASFPGLAGMSLNFFAFASIALFSAGDDQLHFDNYEIVSRAAGSDVPVGSNYCGPAVTNSTGQPGRIEAWGSTIVSANNLRLEGHDLPPNQFGFFLNSLTQGFIQTPTGSQGNLCLGGAIGRYNMPVQSTGSAGELLLVLDLNNTPTPSGPTSVMAGQTWNFQAWHRDLNPTPTSNFTDAVSIDFQ